MTSLIISDLVVCVFSEIFQKLSAQTGLPAIYLVGAVVGTLLAIMVVSFGLSAVTYVNVEC